MLTHQQKSILNLLARHADEAGWVILHRWEDQSRPQRSGEAQNAENLLHMAKQVGIVETSWDEADQDTAGDDGSLIVPGDPYGSISVDLTTEATNYLIKLKKAV